MVICEIFLSASVTLRHNKHTAFYKLNSAKTFLNLVFFFSFGKDGGNVLFVLQPLF